MHTTSTDKLTNRNPYAKVHPEMDKYRDVVLFPEKLAKANEVIANKKIPQLMQPKISAEK